ncbi:MAG: DUF6090 family protein [Bacteroidales bacterium]|nr:DUF6090 family protein [Bacteroidales bacterium]
MKKIQIKSWKKFSFEFLSIFIAVISAFALNNWNENRKNQNAESKILTEIYNGLQKDLVDLKLNEKGHKTGIEASNYFRDLLANKPVFKDSVMFHYFNLTRDFVSIQNTSGYETLKSRGLELIQNDTLRTKIISLYEYDYTTLRKLEEDYFEMQFQENYFKEINLSISPNFEFDENKLLIGIKTPLEIEESEEKVLLTYLWKIQANRNFILHYYSEVANKIKEVRKDIWDETNN